MIKGLTVVILRGKHTKRNIIAPKWDEYVERIKTKNNYLVVDFGEYDIFEQIKIARSAETLIGLHGAALTHGLWMYEGANLIEVDDQFGFRCHCYKNIASWKNLNYKKIHQNELIFY
jgi:capsular polysaccharide biosynthesis protein